MDGYERESNLLLILWGWVKNILILAGSIFFLIFGIGNLTGAYKMANPHEFIMYFFSASLMILISLTGIIYVFFRVKGLFKTAK